MLALALMLVAPPTVQVRGPVADDDGTGNAVRAECRAAAPDEIQVCQRRDPNGDRLGTLPAAARRTGFTPAVRLPGGSAARAEAQQHDAGITSVPAAMVTLRIPIGGNKKKPQDDPKQSLSFFGRMVQQREP